MFQSNPFYMKISGPYALFTDPMSKANGEKFTYQVPTAQALQGIVEAVYWKPTLRYVVDEVKVLKPIQTETKNILVPMMNGDKDLSYYTYLKDVAYAVKFHFEWAHRPDMAKDRNEKKHEQILLRSMKRTAAGQRIRRADDAIFWKDVLRHHVPFLFLSGANEKRRPCRHAVFAVCADRHE